MEWNALWLSRRRSQRQSTREAELRAGRPTGVLFVHTKRRPPLGADTWVHLEIIRGLDRASHDVHVACAAGRSDRPTPTYEAVRQIPDVTIRPVNLGRELAGGSLAEKVMALFSLLPAIWSVVRLAVYVRRRGISILHTSDRPRDAFVCVLLGRITGATCIVHVHVGYDPAWMRRSLQRSIHRADARIAISCFVGDTLVRAGCDPASVFVVHNGIDLDKWEPGHGRGRVRSELGLDEPALIVLTVCRLFPSKGTSELVRAFHDADAAALGATLLVVGTEMEDGYLERLRADVHRFGIEDRVRFLGHRNDVPDVMAAADVFAMPSRFEPFGLVYAEAMAMGLPVVALANGGAIEIVDHGVTGLLCTPGDADDLANSLRLLLEDPAKRSEFGRRGRQRVEELFTTRRMVARVAEVYTLIRSHQH